MKAEDLVEAIDQAIWILHGTDDASVIWHHRLMKAITPVILNAIREPHADLIELCRSHACINGGTHSYGHAECRAAAIVNNPDVVIPALGADKILDYLETSDGFGFVVEYLRAAANGVA